MLYVCGQLARMLVASFAVNCAQVGDSIADVDALCGGKQVVDAEPLFVKGR
jgi:hypothetical protein